jgi:serine/threonine protein kinase
LLTKGISIGNFILEEKLGQGGQQAPVWLARQINGSGLQHALKITLVPWNERDGAEYSEKRRAFKAELDALRPLASNSHIVSLHSCEEGAIDLEDSSGQSEPFFYQILVMEYSSDGDMSKPSNTQKFGLLDSRSKIRFLQDIAAGVEAIHDKAITFCDLKPSNILLFTDVDRLAPRISDFGAARRAVLGHSAFGTPGYIAPEVRDGVIPNFKSDIFSLGVTFHQLLTGYFPNAKDPLRNRQKNELEFFRGIYQTLDYSKETLDEQDELLRPLVGEMLSAAPAGRPTAQEVVERLEQLQDEITRSTIMNFRPASRVQMNFYRWNPEVHRKLGQRMHFLFLSNLGIDDWESVKKKLFEKKIYSFCIHRVLGETNYILRGWFPDSLVATVYEIASGYDGQSSETERRIFKVAEALPVHKSKELEKAPEKSSEFVEWLKQSVGAWNTPEQEKNLRSLGLVDGRISATPPNRIRVFLRIDVSNDLDLYHSTVYAEVIEKYFSTQEKKLKRIEPGTVVWRLTTNNTFIVEFRLKAFHLYSGLVIDLHKHLNEKNLKKGKSKFDTATFLELDRSGLEESYDGGITDLLKVLRKVRGPEDI